MIGLTSIKIHFTLEIVGRVPLLGSVLSGYRAAFSPGLVVRAEASGAVFPCASNGNG